MGLSFFCTNTTKLKMFVKLTGFIYDFEVFIWQNYFLKNIERQQTYNGNKTYFTKILQKNNKKKIFIYNILYI